MTTNEKTANLRQLAQSWVSTDTAAIRKDVARLGSVEAAAKYSSRLAVGQDDWEALSTEEGVAALVEEIKDILTTKQLGIDHTGTWTPNQYVIDAGWPHEAIAETARIGVSEEDAEGLTDDQQAALLAFCKSRATYRFSDEATSDTYTAHSIEDACEQYLEKYDTADMADGDTFTARCYDPENSLVAVVTVTADGKSGVKSWSIDRR